MSSKRLTQRNAILTCYFEQYNTSQYSVLTQMAKLNLCPDKPLTLDCFVKRSGAFFVVPGSARLLAARTATGCISWHAVAGSQRGAAGQLVGGSPVLLQDDEGWVTQRPLLRSQNTMFG